MAVSPQISVRMNSAYRREGGYVPLIATLEGRTLHLRSGLLSAVKVNVDELREALAVLERGLPDAPNQEER